MTASSSTLAINGEQVSSGEPTAGSGGEKRAKAFQTNADALAPLAASCAVAHFHQIAADPATLAHQLGLFSSNNLTTDDLLRAAGHLGLLTQSDGKRILFQESSSGHPTTHYLLAKAEHEKSSAMEILSKLEQTLPTYKKSAQAYAKLEKEDFFSNLAAAKKQHDAIEKSKDLDAQQSTVEALNATIAAQHKRISQLQSSYQSELQKELADVGARTAQLQPSLDKSVYKEGLMELRAPQDGVIKDLATTTVGAVVQPGTVVLTLVPQGEQLFADVNIKNDDDGFVQVGQSAQIMIA